jgi:predicted regulator of Ras-like GTPase activity (Roadblock/LC7/MglB family)
MVRLALDEAALCSTISQTDGEDLRSAQREFTMKMESGDSSDNLKGLLSRLIERSGALTALLVTKEGVPLTEAGDTSYLNTTAMAALVAGMFSATREVARMVGEKQFSILLQQGENRHIHISLIHDSKMMVIVFEDYQRIGLVRHEARRMGEEIGKALVQQETRREYALNLIDRIFETK